MKLFQSLKIILKSIILNLVYTSVPSKLSSRDFPGRLMVKIPCITAGDTDSIPSWGTKTLHAVAQTRKGGKKLKLPKKICKKEILFSLSISAHKLTSSTAKDRIYSHTSMLISQIVQN